MPGVIGVGLTNDLSARLCEVSRKLKNSNSIPVSTEKPAFAARARTRLSTCRGQTCKGPPFPSSKSPRKNGTSSSQGTLR
jgi:hypothetical protein